MERILQTTDLKNLGCTFQDAKIVKVLQDYLYLGKRNCSVNELLEENEVIVICLKMINDKK